MTYGGLKTYPRATVIGSLSCCRVAWQYAGGSWRDCRLTISRLKDGELGRAYALRCRRARNHRLRSDTHRVFQYSEQSSAGIPGQNAPAWTQWGGNSPKARGRSAGADLLYPSRAQQGATQGLGQSDGMPDQRVLAGDISTNSINQTIAAHTAAGETSNE
jgi:hypothetical protein